MDPKPNIEKMSTNLVCIPLEKPNVHVFIMYGYCFNSFTCVNKSTEVLQSAVFVPIQEVSKIPGTPGCITNSDNCVNPFSLVMELFWSKKTFQKLCQLCIGGFFLNRGFGRWIYAPAARLSVYMTHMFDGNTPIEITFASVCGKHQPPWRDLMSDFFLPNDPQIRSLQILDTYLQNKMLNVLKTNLIFLGHFHRVRWSILQLWTWENGKFWGPEATMTSAVLTNLSKNC